MLVKGKTNRGRANEARAMRGDRRNLNRAFNKRRSRYLASTSLHWPVIEYRTTLPAKTV
jgi:hypothetical protein